MESLFFRYQNRLAQFRKWDNSPQDWEERWSAVPLQHYFTEYSKGFLGEFEYLTKYLSPDALILEAGCGLGQIVLALQARGYRVEGVDYSGATICRVKQYLPNINIRVGDIYNLDVPDGFYGCYLSFGVFEHNHAGPSEGLVEVQRVLSPNGVAMISVPYLNKKRLQFLLRSPMTDQKQGLNGFSFYQYYFSVAEFASYLEKVGLQVVDLFPYAVYAGLTRDFSLGDWLFQKRFFSYRLRDRIINACAKASMWARFRYAHMMMFICRKI